LRGRARPDTKFGDPLVQASWEEHP
jgi:hypothetical protein